MPHRYRIEGRDSKTDEAIELVLQADSVESATAKATERGIIVESVGLSEAPSRQTLPPLLRSSENRPIAPKSQDNSNSLSKANGPRHRWWLLIVGLVILFLAPFFPAVPLLFGLALLISCFGVFIPKLQRMSYRVLKINSKTRWRKALRLTLYGVTGFFFVFFAWSSFEIKAEQQRSAARLADAEARQLRLIGKANAEVVALVADATDALKAGDIDAGRALVRAALTISRANELTDAKKLDQQIGNATDPSRIRATLMELSDEAFQKLQKGGDLPKQLISGYEVLDSRTADLARVQLADIVVERAQRRQKQLESRRAAAEAAKKAKEERKARRVAVAEAERKKVREERIEKTFSGWDGSHRALTKLIKASMNDPDSYDHVETVYWDRDDNLVVKTTFRGKNAFGGVVKNWVKAKVDLNGNVIEVISQGP